MVNLELGRSRDSVVAVVDVSAGAASVAILSVPKSGPSRVVSSGHSTLSLEEHTKEQHLASIAQHIQAAGESALKTYEGSGHRSPIRTVYAIAHAPWVETRTVTTEKRNFQNETRITDALIAELAHTAVGKAVTDSSSIVEASIVRVMLNGYPTSRPAGKYAHLVEATSLVSTDEAGIRDAVASAIQKLFPVSTTVWRSFARALITFCREATSFGPYLAIDMRADATHVLSYRYGVLEQYVAPVGVATILTKLGADPTDTLTALRMLSSDACSTEACERVQKAMLEAEPELVRVFGEALSHIASMRRSSNDLLLITHPDLESWLSRFFSRIDFAQFTTTTLPFTVHTPSSIETARYVSGELPDIALTIASALVNTELTD